MWALRMLRGVFTPSFQIDWASRQVFFPALGARNFAVSSRKNL
jgi:hypothetical protein